MYEWDGAGRMGGMWFWWIVGIAIVAAAIWAMVRTSSRTRGNPIMPGSSGKGRQQRSAANGCDEVSGLVSAPFRSRQASS